MTDVVDADKRPLAVGSKVRVSEKAEDHGVVTEISEPDANFDYERNIYVGDGPYVTVRFADGDDDTFPALKAPPRWMYDDEGPYICDDVELVATPTDTGITHGPWAHRDYISAREGVKVLNGHTIGGTNEVPH